MGIAVCDDDQISLQLCQFSLEKNQKILDVSERLENQFQYLVILVSWTFVKYNFSCFLNISIGHGHSFFFLLIKENGCHWSSAICLYFFAILIDYTFSSLCAVLFVHVYVHISVGGHLHVCTHAHRGQCWVSFSIIPHLILWGRVSHWTQTSPLGKTDSQHNPETLWSPSLKWWYRNTSAFPSQLFYFHEFFTFSNVKVLASGSNHLHFPLFFQSACVMMIISCCCYEIFCCSSVGLIMLRKVTCLERHARHWITALHQNWR